MRMRVIGMVIILAAAVSLAAAQANGARTLLETARKIETVDGNLSAAIAKYQEVVDRYGKADRGAAAEALVRIGECYRLMGDDVRARATFERITADFADLSEHAALARRRLAAAEPKPVDTPVLPRLVCESCGDPYGAISTNGMLLATTFFSGGSQGDIGVRNLQDGTHRPLNLEGAGPDGSGAALFPVFSPDARQIVYLWSMGANRTELRIAPRTGGTSPRDLLSNPEFRYMVPSGWTREGTIVTLAQLSDQTWEILKVSAASGEIQKLHSLQWRISQPAHTLSVSPDGRFVAYDALAVNPSAPVPPARADTMDRQIYLLALDGTRQVQLTTGAGVKKSPVWTPDGRFLLYTSNVSGEWDLWAAPVAAGKPGTPLLVKKAVGNVIGLGVSDQGTYHYWEGRTGIFRTTIATLAGPSNAAAAIIGTRPTWAPDGRSVALGRYRPDGAPGIDIVVHSLNNGEERLFKRPGIGDFPPLWFPDGKGLLLRVREGNDQTWQRLDLSSGEFTRLAQHRSDPGFRTHWTIKTLSADGKRLYFGTYAEGDGQQLDRVVALDLESGNYRHVFTLPIEKSGLPAAAQEFAIAAAPDGRRLALLYRDRSIDLVRLATVGVDGSGYRELIEPFRAVHLRHKLAWSRDGRFLYATSHIGDQAQDLHQVIRIPATGGPAVPVGDPVEGMEAFDISPDGTRIAFSTLRPEGAGSLHWTLDVGSILRDVERSASRKE